MIPHELLNDNYTLERAEAIQIKYLNKLNKQNVNQITLEDYNEIHYVAGIDVSYYEKSESEHGVSCAVLWDIKNDKIIEKKIVEAPITFPYKAGLLGFRECSLLAKALQKLENSPDLIMCDGHGIIHPRRFGEAVQLGYALDIPSFGVAKNPFVGFFEFELIGKNKGDKTPILAEQPKTDLITSKDFLGYATRLRDNAKPVYISVGYKITLDLAIKIALNTTMEHRQPEPLFLADRFSREKIKET